MVKSSPNILAIDTSGVYLSLAVQSQEKRFYSINPSVNQSSQSIIDKIKDLLQQAHLLPQNLDIIAYIQGPGSFTGLRIGLSVALGISLGSQAQLLAIPTFTLYACATDVVADNIVVALDAGLKQVYLAGINRTNLNYFIQPTLLYPQDIVIPDNYQLIGNGFQIYKDLLPNTINHHNIHS